jgi:hypothetical protein
MAGLTGSMIIANLGLLKNNGLEINQELIQVVNTFTTTNISGSVQKLVANATPALMEVLQSTPVCFTGFLPDGVEEPPNITVTNIPQSVLNQANVLFKSPAGAISVTAFIRIFSEASAYCSQSSGMQNSIAAARGKQFNELGAQFQNYTDVITGGISNQFKLSAVPALAAELPNLGTMFNTAVLSKISDPGALAQHLIDLGLGSIGNLNTMINENNITLDQVDSTEKNLLINIFKKITGSELSSIVQATKFKPVNISNINTLADVLIISNLFSSAALEAFGANASLDAFANKLSNIGGKFASMADIGKFLSGLNLTTFPAMQSLTSILPDDLSADLDNLNSKGSGANGTTTITDLIGCINGAIYNSRIKSINKVQQNLLETDVDVLNFKNYLDQYQSVLSNSSNSSNPTAISIQAYVSNLQVLINKITSKSTLTNTLNNANQQMIDCANQLVIEKRNLQLAKIVPGVLEATTAEVQMFVNNLGKLSPETDVLKIGDFLASIATNDVYGEAIKASITEGQNLTRMAAYGININTKLG